MSLPDGLQTVTVTGQFVHPDGIPFRGRVTFTPEPAAITSAAHGVIVLGDTAAEPDPATGVITVTLLATDAAECTPTGWTYRVSENWRDAPCRDYPISLPTAAPNVDLADIAPTAPAKGEYVVITGPPGPAGPPGSSGGTYLHTQTSPAATWQVTHNLGRTPNVSVILTDGRVAYADVIHNDDTLAVITFPTATAGTAMCS